MIKEQPVQIFLSLSCFMGLYNEMHTHSFQSVCSSEMIYIENPIVSIVFQCNLQSYLFLILNYSVQSL